MASVDNAAGFEASAKRPESATRGTVLLSGAQACMLISNGVVNIVAAQVLPEEDYGRFVVAMLVLAWANTVVASAVLPGLRKIVSEDRGRFRAALFFAAKWHSAAALAAGVVLLCGAWPLARAFGDGKLTLLFLLAAAQIPLMGATRLGTSLLTGVQRFGASSLVRAGYAFFYAVAACALLLAGLGAAGGVGGAVTGALLAGAVAAALLAKERRRAAYEPYPPMSRRVAYWASVSLPNELGQTTLMILGVWLVKAMMADPKAAGVYGVAYFVARAPMFVVYGMSAAVFARVSSALAAGKTAYARYAAAEAMRVLMILFVPVCFVVAVASSEIVTFLFSSKHAGAAPSLVVLAPAVFFAGQLHLARWLLGAAHRPGVRLIVTSCLVAGAVAANVLLIPRLGIMGAALASLIIFGAGAAAGTALVYRFLGALPPVLTALRCCLAGWTIYAVGRLWPAPGWLVLVKVTALGLLYLAVLFVLRELTRKDILEAIRRVRT